MGCGDVRLLRTIGGVDVTGQERAALTKLTMPRGPHTATRSASNIAARTFRPDATTSSWSSACASTRMSTNGRCRGAGNADWRPRMPVPNFFMAAPFWGLQPQVFPPAVYHDQQGAAALNFNS